jgi:hypothetical protein
MIKLIMMEESFSIYGLFSYYWLFSNLFFTLSFLLEITLSADIQNNNRSTDLNALLVLVAHLNIHVILFNKRSKFRFVIENIKTVAIKFNNGMVSRYRNIRNPYLTIVASAQLDTPFRNVFYHHHTFGFLAGSLQN